MCFESQSFRETILHKLEDLLVLSDDFVSIKTHQRIVMINLWQQ